MEFEPIWYEYATFDDDGFVNGIRDDAPDEIREAYQKEQERIREAERSGEMIQK